MKVKSIKKQMRDAMKPLLYEETDEWGTYQVKERTKKIIFKDRKIERIPGIKTRLLVKPSSKYRKKVAERKKQYLETAKKKQAEINKEKLITEKIRELAIRELKAEGKLK